MHVLPPSQIATSPVLVLVGIIIFASAVIDINWEDYSEAVPVLVTTTIMPFTSNVSGATTRPRLRKAFFEGAGASV